MPLIRHLAEFQLKGTQIPVLGVCLGHQAIGAAFGGNVVRAPKLMHGKTSEVEHDGQNDLRGIPTPMTCTRYHSLIVEEGLAGGAGDVGAGEGRRERLGGLIMALRHRTLPIEGVQFHPESVLTDHGKQFIANFLKM